MLTRSIQLSRLLITDHLRKSKSQRSQFSLQNKPLHFDRNENDMLGEEEAINTHLLLMVILEDFKLLKNQKQRLSQRNTQLKKENSHLTCEEPLFINHSQENHLLQKQKAEKSSPMKLSCNQSLRLSTR